MKIIKYVVICSMCMLLFADQTTSQTGKKTTPSKLSATVVYPRPITVAAGFQSVIEDASKIVLPRNPTRAKKYPVVIFLPWTGGDATQHFNLYADQLIKTDPFVAMITPEPASTKDHSWQGFEAAVFRYENRILKDLEDLKKRQMIDTSKVILAGFSMGGDIAWALVQRHPQIFKGAIISGSRTSWSEKNGIAQMKPYNSKFYFVMGNGEAEVRLKGLNKTLAQLDKGQIDYQYERTEGGHTSPNFELFASGLKYVFE